MGVSYGDCVKEVTETVTLSWGWLLCVAVAGTLSRSRELGGPL